MALVADDKFYCDYEGCTKSFTQKRNLTRHKKLHTGDAAKLHKCEHCDRSFARKHDLTTHLRTHSGDKPYVCKECGKRYSKGSDLRLHERRHKNIRPYVCDTCHKAFFRPCDLKAHKLRCTPANVTVKEEQTQQSSVEISKGCCSDAPQVSLDHGLDSSLDHGLDSDIKQELSISGMKNSIYHATPKETPEAIASLDVLCKAAQAKEKLCPWIDCSCPSCICGGGCQCGKTLKTNEQLLQDSQPTMLEVMASPSSRSTAIRCLKSSACPWQDCQCGTYCKCRDECSCGKVAKTDFDWGKYLDTLLQNVLDSDVLVDQDLRLSVP